MGGFPGLWDGLVRAVEQEVYLRAGYGKPFGFGTHPALLVVDVEYNFTGERPAPILDAVREYSDSCGEFAWAALPNIQCLLTAFRDRRLPVFFTHGIVKPGEEGNPKAHQGVQVHEIIAPRAGEIILPKVAASAFFGTPLVTHLVRERVDTVVVTGCTTSGCVRATVVDSHSYRFKTIVPAEAVFDRTETPHRLNLFDMAMKYADVLPMREVKAWLEGRSDWEAARPG